MGSLNLATHKTPLFGQFFENPNETRLKQSMQEAGTIMQAYRPEMADARQQALQTQLNALAPANRALTEMYGPGAAMDLQAPTLVSEGMLDLGTPRPYQTTGGREKMGRNIGGVAGALLTPDPLFGGIAGSKVGGRVGKKRDRKKGGK